MTVEVECVVVLSRVVVFFVFSDVVLGKMCCGNGSPHTRSEWLMLYDGGTCMVVFCCC